ncbi:MAG: hypothetical protein JRN26_03440 [Nitrososphaerota archaeon]|jgi:uncharacterized C2H2 Zn-finger protein|nr:hypothetical protein [Nitrososphaerota archaeon]MDG6927066.1 hypothetical protein [Nitrososphaerota archaeon]MDG6930566.1 hypothetical protein [Nitrososphaerota archaeon]MDG6932367.1 hypothetical protein [Nitrososphaerota archaeon]MDG6935926.1 hypothetical protein [Nitrososphaerota archaeon]
MNFWFLLIIPVAAAVILVLILRGRGNWLKCPECGEVFLAPVGDEKITGLGWTFAGMGAVKCPKCGIKRPRRDYERVKPPNNLTNYNTS